MDVDVTILDNTVYVVTDDTERVTVTSNEPSPGQTGITWEDDGVALGTRSTVNEVDFVGSGVAATRVGDKLTVTVTSGGGTGDVTGPSGAVADNIAIYNGVTGKIIKDGGSTIASLQAATALKLDIASAPHVTLCIMATGAATVNTNQPNSEEYFFNGTFRNSAKFDGTNFGFVRLVVDLTVGSASVNTPRMYIKYKTSFSSGDAIGAFTTVGSGTGSEVCSLTTAGIIVTSWITIPAGALADVFWTVAINGGDGTADPSTGSVHIQFKIA